MPVPRLDARDVLDACTSGAALGRVLGGIVEPARSVGRLGLVEEHGGPIEVFAGTPVQLENEGAVFRMRHKGEVLVVAWVPAPGEADGAPTCARSSWSCCSGARRSRA